MLSETVKEWIAKAEGDFAVSCREMRARKARNHDAICFHCQQCVEKLMKALLIHLGATPPKTHMLLALDELLCSVCSQWSWPADELRFLSHAAIFLRYRAKRQDQRNRVKQWRSPRRFVPSCWFCWITRFAK